MRYKWLNQKHNEKLIIFFNGWGMDENIVSHLDSTGFDVLMFYDYNTLDTDFDFELLNIYNEKNLIAWSMGVMIGSLMQPLTRHFVISSGGKSVAINGTLKPISAEYGIHPKIYDLTIKGFNEKGRERFISSMFDTQYESIPHPTHLSNGREISNQLSELIALKNYSSDEDFKYDKVVISDSDKIIPTKSQVNFWKIEPNLKGGHCPFFQFKNWSELL